VKVDVAVGLTLCVPVVLRLPPQPPEAIQLSASFELQVKAVDCPCSMLADDTDRFTTGTGTGAVTVTLTLSLTLPPAPLQVRV
jgi:hypothetical protein